MHSEAQVPTVAVMVGPALDMTSPEPPSAIASRAHPFGGQGSLNPRTRFRSQGLVPGLRRMLSEARGYWLGSTP